MGITAPPTPDAGLTTVDRLLANRSLTALSDVALLARLGRAASARVEQYCGRRFQQATYIDAHDGGGRTLLLLRNTPVVSVAWVKSGAVEVPPSVSGGAGYLVIGDMLALQGGARFARGPGSVVVEYAAGFAAVPEDVQQAVDDLVALKFAQQDKKRIGLTSEAMSGQTTSYFTGAMPADVADVLQQYKRVALV